VYFLSLYLQKVHHFSPVQTGLGLLPSTLTVVLMSTLVTRRLLTRFGARPVLLAGLVIMTAGQLWLAFMITGQSSYLDGVLPGLLLTSLSIGLSLPAASVAITTGVHGRDQGIAGAMFTTGQQVGAAVGLAVLATAAAARTAASGDVVAGYRLSFLIAAGLGAFGVALVALARSPARSREPVGTPSPAASPEQPARD
jgi:MFS family permease